MNNRTSTLKEKCPKRFNFQKAIEFCDNIDRILKAIYNKGFEKMLPTEPNFMIEYSPTAASEARNTNEVLNQLVNSFKHTNNSNYPITSFGNASLDQFDMIIEYVNKISIHNNKLLHGISIPIKDRLNEYDHKLNDIIIGPLFWKPPHFKLVENDFLNIDMNEVNEQLRSIQQMTDQIEKIKNQICLYDQKAKVQSLEDLMSSF